jgi:hypothetical protein
MRARTFAPALAGAAALAAAALVLPAGGAAHHDQPDSWWNPPRDVRAMLGDISARQLRSDDLTLVGFGTRHTLSSQTDPHRGIGAARDWIRSQFEQDAARSGGRMTVGVDTPTACRSPPCSATRTSSSRAPIRRRPTA